MMVYEEWIRWPHYRVYVSREQHDEWAGHHGWWCTDWKGDEQMLLALGVSPTVRPPSGEPAPEDGD